MGKQVALYLRVSTTRQAEKDLSIPDQRRQALAYCERNGWNIVAEYVEPGASATDDKRPEFQKMIDQATSGLVPVDIVLVHSFSRFFRDAYQFEFYRRKLAKAGIDVVSLTQQLGDDPTSDMVRQVLNIFDEYQSKENAKHVLRAMKENARQGFWNGSQPPFGYRTVTASVRADAIKKKLEIEPSEANTVEEIFSLYLQGKGIRAIAHLLNSKGLRYRKGRRFGVSLVHAILTRAAYKGTHYFNKTGAKTRTRKDRSEWVPCATPVIIDPATFDQVQATLESRRPTNTPPRVVNGPTLLTGIAKCGTCGGGMTIRTGKGGRYRYYACNTRMTEGKSACEGRNMPMAQLDDLVLTALQDRLFSPERLKSLLSELVERTRSKAQTLGQDEKTLRKELRAVEEKIDRLYDALADGLVENSDGFKRNLGKIEHQRDELLRQVSMLGRRRDVPNITVTPKNIEAFAKAVSGKLRGPDPSFRKSYLRQFVNRIDVGDEEVRICGPKAALAGAIMQNGHSTIGGVPTFDREWWAHKDSNLGPAD